MIVVNSPGHPGVAYGPLLHARWHGFTPTDLVFPTFLFVVGLAMSVGSRDRGAIPEALFWRKTLQRTGLIFLLGFLSYWFPFVDFGPDGIAMKPLGETRILGVLQRIALCALLAAVVLRYGSKRTALALSAAILLGYWIVSVAFGDPCDPYGLQGNAGLRLDLWLFGERHLYHGEGVAFDPEGLLSTFPSTVNVIAGFLAGDFLRERGKSYESIAKLLMAGVLTILAALTWGMAFPINKKLWSSSFVLLTVGLDLLVLGLLTYAIDVADSRSWTRFFSVFGRNPLFLYLLSELGLTALSLLRWQASLEAGLEVVFSPVNASLLFALLFMLSCWTAGWLLDRRGILIKV